MIDFRKPLYIIYRVTFNNMCIYLFTFVLTFSKEGGLTSEKQTRKTSVWGYESGLNLS